MMYFCLLFVSLFFCRNRGKRENVPCVVTDGRERKEGRSTYQEAGVGHAGRRDALVVRGGRGRGGHHGGSLCVEDWDREGGRVRLVSWRDTRRRGSGG
jgi:hypothetical protein